MLYYWSIKVLAQNGNDINGFGAILELSNTSALFQH